MMQSGYVVIKSDHLPKRVFGELSAEEAEDLNYLKTHCLHYIGPSDHHQMALLQQNCIHGKLFETCRIRRESGKLEKIHPLSSRNSRRLVALLSYLYGLPVPTSLPLTDRVMTEFLAWFQLALCNVTWPTVPSDKIATDSITQYAKCWEIGTEVGIKMNWLATTADIFWIAYAQTDSNGVFAYVTPEYLINKHRFAADVPSVCRAITAYSLLYELPIPKAWTLVDDYTIALYLWLAGRHEEVMA